MRIIIQRVTSARVTVAEEVTGQIGQGLLVLVGVAPTDGPAEVAFIAQKVCELRIFADDTGKMNRSVQEIGGAILLVSQFTLFGDIRKGRRPGFTGAAPPELASRLYQELIAAVAARGIPVATGKFAADMQVELINDGPVTIYYDTVTAVD